MSEEERKQMIDEIIEMAKQLEKIAKKKKQGVTPVLPVGASKTEI